MQQKFLGETCNYPNIDMDEIYKVKADSGSKSVKTLSSKFDFQEKEVEGDKTNLKRVVKEQKKLISNLKDQVEVKDRRIQELEAKVKLLLSNNRAANLNISIKHQNGHSLA
jgi:phage shock protein A